MISSRITGSSAPDIPLQVVQANATIPKPSFSSSGSRPASFKYSSATFEPGANEDFTQGLRTKPSSLAFFATKPAATTLRGFEVLVQEVIAAIITAPSGIKPCSSSALAAAKFLAMPLAARSAVETRACGFDGPAMLRPTLERSKLNTRSYSASFRVSAHRPVSLANCSTNST